MPAVSFPARREEAQALDEADDLRSIRDEFIVPEGVVYLDGNSLGPLPRAAVDRVREVMLVEWGSDLIRSWTSHGWSDLPFTVGRSIAPLVGAEPDEVVVTDSTSVNLFKLLSAALRLRPGRPVILSERENFPTDLYMAQGLGELLGTRAELRLVGRSDVAASLDERVGVLMLTHVDFRTGEILDMPGLTSAAHEAGALALWDLSHSAGAVPVDLNGCEADLAAGCGYKYLNGGPGAPAYAFAARRHLAELRQPLSGWMGHEAPFEFATGFRPAPGVAKLLCGTPGVLGMAALACGVEIVARAGVERLRRKSTALTELFMGLMERECGAHGFEPASPADAAGRGSQVSYRHPNGYAIMQALIRDGVIGDFRPPDLLRFGFGPAFVRFVDVWDAVARLRKILDERSWDRPELAVKAKVT